MNGGKTWGVGVDVRPAREALLAALVKHESLIAEARARVDNIPRYHRGTHEVDIPDMSVTSDPRNHAEAVQPGGSRCAWQESNLRPRAPEARALSPELQARSSQV
jgi:hypothetical protein